MPFFNLHGIKWHYPEGVDLNSIRHLIPMARSDADLMRARNPGLQVSAFTRPGMYAIRNNFGVTDVHLAGGVPPIEVRPEPVSMEVQVEVQYIVYDIMDRLPTWEEYEWFYTGNYLATKVAVNAQGMARAMAGVPYHQLGDKKFFSLHDTTTIEPARVVSGRSLREAGNRVRMNNPYNGGAADKIISTLNTKHDIGPTSYHNVPSPPAGHDDVWIKHFTTTDSFDMIIANTVKKSWTRYLNFWSFPMAHPDYVDCFCTGLSDTPGRWKAGTAGEHYTIIDRTGYWPPVDKTADSKGGYPYIMANEGMESEYVKYGIPGCATDNGEHYILFYEHYDIGVDLMCGVGYADRRDFTYYYKEYPNNARVKVWPYSAGEFDYAEGMDTFDGANLSCFRVYNSGNTYLYCFVREIYNNSMYWNTYEYILATRDKSGAMKETTLEYTGRVDPDGNLPGHEVELDGETYYLAGHIKLAEETALYIVEPHIP